MTATSRLPLRLLVIVAVGLLPAIGLAVLLLTRVERDVAAARREQRGLEYLAAVKALAKAALEHRRTAVEYIAGSADNLQVARRAEAVNSALRAVESLDAQLGDDDTHGALGNLRGEWEALAANLPAWARADDFNAFWARSGAMLLNVRTLAEAAAGVSGLSADPERISHELQDALTVLIRDADHLSQASLLTRHAARAPRLERATEKQLQRLLAYIEDDGAALRRDHAGLTSWSATRYGASRAMQDREDAGNARSKLVKAVEANVLRDAAPVDETTATTVTTLGEQGIGEDFELFDAASRALSDGLADRIAARDRTIVWASSAVVVGFTLALLAAYLVGRSLARRAPPAATVTDPARFDQLRRLAERVQQVADGLEETPVRLGRAGGQVARVCAGVRGIEPAARLLEEMADESSVAALNIELRAATSEGVAVAPEVDRLAERSVATARRIIELARAAENEAVALGKGLREIPLADAAQLTSLATELRSAVDKLQSQK